MSKFKDNQGRDWSITLNLTNAKRVRDILSVDVFDLYGTTGDKLLSDPYTLCNVLWLLIEDQAKFKNVTDVSFGESLFGDVLRDAVDALLVAVSDFFPEPRRTQLRKIKELLDETDKLLHKKTMMDLEMISTHELSETVVN